MVHYVKGNLLDAPVDYVCHQVNCQGRMGSGVAGQIRNRWQAVYDMYMKVADPGMLGRIQSVFIQRDSKILGVINMFAQEQYGYDGRRYTSYDAFWQCLGELKSFCAKGKKIGFPDHIGCGLGGANWEVIRTMIEEVLGEDFEVYIYKLEEETI